MTTDAKEQRIGDATQVSVVEPDEADGGGRIDRQLSRVDDALAGVRAAVRDTFAVAAADEARGGVLLRKEGDGERAGKQRPDVTTTERYPRCGHCGVLIKALSERCSNGGYCSPEGQREMPNAGLEDADWHRADKWIESAPGWVGPSNPDDFSDVLDADRASLAALLDSVRREERAACVKAVRNVEIGPNLSAFGALSLAVTALSVGKAGGET